jgi:hypothetical protein
MLLQSWGGKIAVFPAIPDSWERAVFHDLRAEGAFLVSAERRAGKTAWVRIKSLAGEPCRVQPNLQGKVSGWINGQPIDLAPTANGMFRLPLAKGDEAVLQSEDTAANLTVCPLPADSTEINPFGGPREVKLEPALSTGKQATASYSWNDTYAASRAFDGDPHTRWAGAKGTRSGWLRVDLGEARTIGRIAIAELDFPSAREFTIEYQAGDEWKEVARGTTIDGMKIFTFPPIQTQVVRLNILRTEAANYPVPTISEMQLFEK